MAARSTQGGLDPSASLDTILGVIAFVLASWSEPSPWFAIGVAAVALIAAIAYPARANRIAARALAISEREERARERERTARAQLSVSVAVVGYEPDEDGVIRLGGSHGNLRLSIAIRNEGDRDAERGNIEVALPLSISDLSARWSDPGGRELPEFPQRAARVGEANIIVRTLDGIGRDVPETLYLTVPVAIPDRGVNEYPIRVRVAAQGADGEEVVDYPLRIGNETDR